MERKTRNRPTVINNNVPRYLVQSATSGECFFSSRYEEMEAIVGLTLV